MKKDEDEEKLLPTTSSSNKVQKQNDDKSKIFAFIALVIIQGTYIISFKQSQKGGEYAYNTVSAIAVTEFIKFCISFGLHVRDLREENVNITKETLFPRVSIRTFLSWTLLALAYVVLERGVRGRFITTYKNHSRAQCTRILTNIGTV